MLLTITTTCAPATDLGYLLHKHPDRLQTHPNYTELLSYADLDSLVELHGHIRAENPTMDVFFKLPSQVVPDALSGHLVLLGGIAWNEITGRLSAMTGLPIRQVVDPAVTTGEIFVVDVAGKGESSCRNGRMTAL